MNLYGLFAQVVIAYYLEVVMMMATFEERWSQSWTRLLTRFEEEAGDPPDAVPEDWERTLLAKLLGEELASPGRPGVTIRRALNIYIRYYI